MPELCNLQIHVNGQHTFFVNEETISKFSGKVRKIINQEKGRSQIRNSGIEINHFPFGPDGFELVSRFCYNNGRIKITVSNACLLHCCALFLEMTEKANLLQETETFFEGMFYWSWNDIITCLKSCETFFSYAQDSPTNLVQKIMCSLLAKIAQNSDLTASSPSSSSSEDTAKPTRRSKNSTWWFHDLTTLPPKMIENFVKTVGGYGVDNNNLVLTRFLLHYLKSSPVNYCDYGGLAGTAVHGVINLMRANRSFSCRGLFSVMRVVAGFGLSRDCRDGLERVIGLVLHEATLDDLLVSGTNTVYDVNLVLRLVKVFVHQSDDYGKKGGSLVAEKEMNKVGALVDDYLGEIAPDHTLKMSKFVAVAESLPDFARASFDGVYRAIDIYLESHRSLSLEERSRLCRCVNYEKLSLQACKDLAKNPRVPPRIAVQALASQHPNIITPPASPPPPPPPPPTTSTKAAVSSSDKIINSRVQMVVMHKIERESEREITTCRSSSSSGDSFNAEDEDMRLNLERMRWRVVELEKECRHMKSQMSRMLITNPRSLPRLC